VNIIDLHHVSLAVADLERARHFYGVVLGLEELERPPFDFAGAWYGLGERQLHLIVQPAGKALRGTRDIDSRDGHFAVRVDSYDDTLRRFDELGIPYVAKPVNKTPWAQIFVTDPDGNVIEFNASIPPL